MTDQHPITPPPELLDQWLAEWASNDEVTGPQVEYVATQAARWGADQELEACCEWLVAHGWFRSSNSEALCGLRDARRPKPQSLKEQALEVLNAWCEERHGPGESILCDGLHVGTIRRALEQLDD